VRPLLDEMLFPVIARELCARGHDVRAVAGHPVWQESADFANRVVSTLVSALL